MVRFLLDTNIVSFLMKESHFALDHKFNSVPRPQCAVSAVVEAELRYGAARRPAQARVHVLLRNILEGMDILPWNSACAQTFGQLRANLELRGESMGLADTMIAAHALTLGLVLVSNDQAFQRVPKLKLQDWTEGPQRA